MTGTFCSSHSGEQRALAVSGTCINGGGFLFTMILARYSLATLGQMLKVSCHTCIMIMDFLIYFFCSLRHGSLLCCFICPSTSRLKWFSCFSLQLCPSYCWISCQIGVTAQPWCCLIFQTIAQLNQSESNQERETIKPFEHKEKL